MKLWLLLPLALLAGCHKGGGAADPPEVVKAEALIRLQVGDKSIGFSKVQPTGAADTGQVCGYFTRKNALGGTDAVRFIVFADGNNGENPFIDQPKSPFPIVKSDFALAWAKLCVKLGFKDGDEPVEDKSKKKKKRY